MSELKSSSRYNWSALYLDSKNGDFFGTRQPLNLREDPSDMFHIVAEFNNIGNPLEIPAGTTLRIPSYSRVQMKVLS